MQKLVKYLLESKIEDMKMFISKSINDTNDEKVIKRIHDILLKSEFDSDVIEKFLRDRAIDDAKKLIISAFESNSNLAEFFELCKGEINLPSAADLVAGSNIYDVFDNLGFDKDTLMDLATINPPRNSVTRGWYEILSQIFLKDLTIGNRGRGDVNAGSMYQIEYKAPNARIKGQNIESTEKIDRKFEELTSGLIDLKSARLERGYLCLVNNINKVSDLLKNVPTDEVINIIAKSLISQFDDNNTEWMEFVYNHKSELFKGKNLNSDFIKELFGVMDMYFYQRDEKFTHMILFKGKERNDKGDYIVMNADMFNTFESIYNSIKSLGIIFTAMPRVSKNSREWVVQIAAK